MKLLALNCKQCGAPIEVLATAEFVTCEFCSARLSVQHTGGTSFTQALDELRERTRKLEQTMKVRRADNPVRRLDRSWRKRRKLYMVKGQDGVLRVPDRIMGTIIGFVGGTIGLVFIVASAIATQGAGTGVFWGALVLGGSLIVAASNHTKADSYHDAHKIYISRRRKKLSELRAEDARPRRTIPRKGHYEPS